MAGDVVIVGGLGFVWVGLWLWFTRGHRVRVIDGPPMFDNLMDDIGPQKTLRQVFLSGKFAIALTTMIAVNVTWHFYNQWFPRYLTQDLQVEPATEQWVLAGFYISADLGSLAFGRLSRELARQGYTVTRARQIVMFTLALGAILFTVLASGLMDVPRSWQWVGFFFVAANVMGGYSVAFGLVQDVAAKHTAQVLGVCGCLSWLTTSGLTKFVGGYAGPGKYADLFLVIGCVPLIAAVVGFLWPREVKRLPAGLRELG